jgi:hypothetical protein
MFYLIWYDDSTKKTPTQKIEAGCAAFSARFNRAPERVLVKEQVDVTGMSVEVLPTIGRDCFWLGPVEGVWL